MPLPLEAIKPFLVEIDGESESIYVHFKRAKIDRTIERMCGKKGLITVDVDKEDDLVGMEIIGCNLTVSKILELAIYAPSRIDWSGVKIKFL